MIRPIPVRSLALALVAVLALLLPAGADAKEESKIKVNLQNVGPDPDARGWLRSKLTPSETTLHVKLGRLEPHSDYRLLADGEQFAVVPTGGEGGANVKIDLRQTGDATTPPLDPRGKYLSVRPMGEEAEDVLAAWVFAAAELDPPKAKIKERTELEPQAEPVVGEAHARYDMRPNGKGRLEVKLKHLEPETDYAIFVDLLPRAVLTTNGEGNAKVKFRTHPGGNGNGLKKGWLKPHNQKKKLDFDPRSKPIEVKQGETILFAGPMMAQIDGLNSCLPDGETVVLDPTVDAPSGAAEMTVGTEETCDPIFEVTISDTSPGLVAGSYDLFVGDGVDPVAAIEVVDDGTTVFGQVRFDANPDEADELPLDFPLTSGAAVSIAKDGVPLFEGMLP